MDGKPPQKTAHLPVHVDLPKLKLPVKNDDDEEETVTTVHKPGTGKEADSVKSEPLPAVPLFRSWKMPCRKNVASASSDPDAAFKWICAVDSAARWGDLSDSGKFATLNSKVSASLGRNLNGDLGRKVNVLEEKATLEGKMLKGRQTLWIIYESYNISDTEGAILEFRDLLNNHVKNENLRQFIND